MITPLTNFKQQTKRTPLNTKTMNKSISFSGSLLRITELPKRSINLDQVSKILSSEDLKELVAIMRELKEENDKLESIMNENKEAIEIIMDKVLDDDNFEQREELPFDDAVLVNKHIGNYYPTY